MLSGMRIFVWRMSYLGYGWTDLGRLCSLNCFCLLTYYFLLIIFLYMGMFVFGLFINFFDYSMLCYDNRGDGEDLDFFVLFFLFCFLCSIYI